MLNDDIHLVMIGWTVQVEQHPHLIEKNKYHILHMQLYDTSISANIVLIWEYHAFRGYKVLTDVSITPFEDIRELQM